MKTVVLHGQKHKGSTWNVTEMLLSELKLDKNDITEFYTNGISHCVGCFTCIMKDENKCPHRSQINDIIIAMENADLIIAESPNYCMGMTGQLKTFFDHLGYRWTSHRPHPSMHKKIGVAIATTAGMGAAGVTKDIKKQMFYWDIPEIYRIHSAVAASSWEEVSPEKRIELAKKCSKTARKILNKTGKVKRGLKSAFIFKIMRLQQKNSSWNPRDKKHWEDNGWI